MAGDMVAARTEGAEGSRVEGEEGSRVEGEDNKVDGSLAFSSKEVEIEAEVIIMLFIGL